MTLHHNRILVCTLVLAPFAGILSAQPTYETALRNLHFRSVGPATMGGRVDDIAAVDSDPRIIYVGAAAGGLFKTTNGGVTWQALWENQSNPSIGDIAISPSNPSIVYVGTGEANNRQSSSWGDGVYKTMDGGATWTHLGLKETHHIGRIVVNPTDPNIVYVAALGDLWGPNKERGVFMSTDGGAHWTQPLSIVDDKGVSYTGVSDIAIDPQSPNILYAAAYQRQRTVFGYNGGGPGSGLYRSTDSGAHWTKLGGTGVGRGLPAGEMGRCAIDIYRKNSNIVYALIEHSTAGGVYRSDDKGATWTHQSDTNPRPSYFSQIRVDPNNENKIWLGGVNIYMSEDAGKTFDQGRFRDVHSDVHGIWIDPSNSDHIVIGCDGGVWVTNDSGRAWRHINNIALGQFYEVAYDFAKPYNICGGAQDNYSWCGPSSTTKSRGIGNEDWFTVQGGDGFYNRIDPSDPNIVYSESQDGNISRRDLRTSESKSIRPQEDNDQSPRYRFQWNSPMAISPHDPKTIYYGGNFMFKSTDRGDTWERLGKDLTTGQDRNAIPVMGKMLDRTTLSFDDGVNTWPCITAIAESPVKAGTLWAGTDDGNLQMSRDGGKTWTNVVSHVQGIQKGAYVSRIEPSHKEEGTVYVTFDNHRAADYGIYIYKTTNYGDSFTRINTGIPVEAGTVHVIREDPANPNLLFAGTEFGLFVTFDRGANWHRMKNGLPTVPVFDLQIQPREHDLILATHGRSFWVMDNISALEEMNDQTLTADLKILGGRPGVQWKMSDYRSFLGSNNLLSPNAPAGVAIDYFAKTAGPVRIVISDKSGKQVRLLNARAEAGVVNRVLWDMRGDPPVPPVAGGGAGAAAGGGGRGAGGAGGGRAGRGGGGGGRGGAAAAATPPAAEAVAGAPAEPGAAAQGLAGELNSEFGAEAGAAGGGGGGGGGRGGRGGGGAPTVEPGEYIATITAGDKKDSHAIVVEDDPRVTFSAADRAKRHDAVDALIALTKQAQEPTRRAAALTTALTSLTTSWQQPNAPKIPDDVKKLVDDLNARVKTASAVFQAAGGGRGGRGGGGGGAGAAAAFVAPPVTQKIQRLMGLIDGYSAAPTSRQLADIQAAREELQKGAADIDKLWDEVGKLNKVMADAGVQYFTVNLNAAPAAPAGGRGN